MKFLFLSALFLPFLVTVAAASAVSRSFIPVAFDKSLRIRITPESSCDGPFMRTRTPSTRSSSSSSKTIQQSSTSMSHKDDSYAFLNVRGGAQASPSLAPSSSWKSFLAFSQGVFQDHVQPALADPENNILKPAKAFLEHLAAVARGKRQHTSDPKPLANEETSFPESASASASASVSNILLQPAPIHTCLHTYLPTYGVSRAPFPEALFYFLQGPNDDAKLDGHPKCSSSEPTVSSLGTICIPSQASSCGRNASTPS